MRQGGLWGHDSCFNWDTWRHLCNCWSLLSSGKRRTQSCAPDDFCNIQWFNQDLRMNSDGNDKWQFSQFSQLRPWNKYNKPTFSPKTFKQFLWQSYLKLLHRKTKIVHIGLVVPPKSSNSNSGISFGFTSGIPGSIHPKNPWEKNPKGSRPSSPWESDLKRNVTAEIVVMRWPVAPSRSMEARELEL